MIENVVLSIVAAIVYSMTVYFKRLNGPAPEEFNWFKLIATGAVGGFIGMFAGGSIPTEASVEVQMAAYAGFSVVAENIAKSVYRFVVKYIPV